MKAKSFPHWDQIVKDVLVQRVDELILRRDRSVGQVDYFAPPDEQPATGKGIAYILGVGDAEVGTERNCFGGELSPGDARDLEQSLRFGADSFELPLNEVPQAF